MSSHPANVLRHQPEEYVRRAAVFLAAFKVAERHGFIGLMEETRVRGLYNLALGLEALAWLGLVREFRRNDARLS